MEIGTIFKAINKHGAIYGYLALFFAFCWFIHFAASMKMEGCNRQFALMNDRTLRAMALIDWVPTHSWLVLAYVLLVVASVAFLQVRGQRSWTYWATAVVYCIPCVVYWLPCAYIAGKLLGP
ncbi:MAG: hypothetical protein ABSG68_25615 [Thermoguttaceae bacterium]|jgi:hypothetical protein